MDRNDKLKMLQELNEKSLRKRFLIPLFSEGMKCKNVRETHGIFEHGIDILYYREDEFGERIYSGAQVKAEKITKSNIPEILCQINDALGGSFTDLCSGEKINVKRIVLMTSHEFTESANQSLRRALQGAKIDDVVICIDGNKLIDFLDQHLPSAFWNQYDYFNRYFQTMKSEFETIKDVSAIGQKEPILLEDVYVSLRLNGSPGYEISYEKIIEKEIKIKIIQEKMDKFFEILKKEETKEYKIYDVDDATKRFNKIVIVGAPGSGKTTLLKHLALRFCRENMETQERVILPILIILKEFFESKKTLREYIDDVFIKFNFPESRDFIEKDLKEGRCWILLDGFDELATIERQMKVTEEIEEFIREYSINKFIITSRSKGYHDELKGFEKLEVMEFNDSQIEKFITNWFEKTDPEKGKLLNKAIMENIGIRAIASNPLMIAIIAVIFEEDRELPQRRVELYERCVDVLLNKWDVTKRIKNKYDIMAKEKVLRKLALEVHTKEKKSFTEEEILKKFGKYLPEVNIEKDKAEDVLKEIVERNALLKEISIGVYNLLHLSFQEYFAAKELWETRNYETLLYHLYESWWEEVILLFAGFDRDATTLLQKILKKEKEDEQFKEDIFYNNLILMGKCIANADHTKSKIKDEIISKLWHLYNTGEFSLLRNSAMEILALIKPDSIISSLIKELNDEDSNVQKSAIMSLGFIGSEKALDPLSKLLNDEDSGVRGRVAIALGKIGSEKAVDPLSKLLNDEDPSVRFNVIMALDKIGSEKAITFLLKPLKNEDPIVRMNATIALGLIRNEKAVDPLLKLLKNEDPIIREAMVDVLGRIESEKAIDHLLKLLTDEDSGVKGRVADMLGRIGNEKAVDPLLKLLTDEDSGVRGRVAIALGKIGSEKAVDPLSKLLNDEDPSVRGRVAIALGRIEGEKAIDLLLKLLSDGDNDIRESAFEILEEISRKHKKRILKKE